MQKWGFGIFVIIARSTVNCRLSSKVYTAIIAEPTEYSTVNTQSSLISAN